MSYRSVRLHKTAHALVRKDSGHECEEAEVHHPLDSKVMSTSLRYCHIEAATDRSIDRCDCV